MFLMMLVMALPVLGLLLFLFLPWKTALVLYVAGTAVALFYHRLMMKSMKLRVTTGRRGMIGREVVVISGSSGFHMVRCGDEIWKAELRGGGSLPPGSEAVVVGVRGLVLVLDPLPSQADRREDRARAGSPSTWTGLTQRITL